MLKAIHKITGQIVPAFKLESDITWIGKENDEWVSPRYEIENWDFLKEKGIEEVKVSFIKFHKRETVSGIQDVQSHFRIITEHALAAPENESEEHKLAKVGIYEDIVNNLFWIGDKKIRDLFEIDDINFEYRLSKSKFAKIADVIVLFKDIHPQYGKGIIFEIQLSHQSFENTEERTFDRITEGYSVVWLWDGMFENFKLKDKHIELIPFLKAQREFQESSLKYFREELNNYGSLYDQKEKQFQDNLKDIEKKGNYLIAKAIETEKEIKLNIKELSDKIPNEILDKTKVKVSQLIQNDQEVKNLISKSINYDYIIEIIKSKEIENIKNKIEEEISRGIFKKINQDISSEVIQKAIKDKSEEIASKFGKFDLKGEIYLECSKCEKQVPAIAVRFEQGHPYCSSCFNSLPNNWYKEFVTYIDRYRKDKMQEWEIKNEVNHGSDKVS